MGGYDPLSRFVCLALLSAASILIGTTPQWTINSLSAWQNKQLPMTVIAFACIAVAQLMPTSDLPVWTGVDQLRHEFVSPPVERHTPLSLASWETKSWFSTTMIGVAGFCLSGLLFTTTRSRLTLLAAIATCGTIQVFWAVVQAIRFPDFIFWGIKNPGSSTPYGTFLNRNHGADFVGMSLACVTGLMWYCHCNSSSRQHRYTAIGPLRKMIASPVFVLLSLLTVWLIGGIAASLSRGAWISTAIALTAVPLCWTSKKGSRRSTLLPVIILCAGIVGVGIQVLGFGDRIGQRIDQLQINHMLSNARLSHWSDATEAIKHFLPFGSGFGTYGHAYLPFNPEPNDGWYQHAHNQYLETLVEGGIPGITLVLLGLMLTFRICRQLCHHERRPSEQAIGIAALITLLMQSLHAFTDFGLMMPANLLTTGLILGMTVSALHSNHPDSPPGFTNWRSRAGTLSIAILVAGLLAGAIWHQAACVRVERALRSTRFSPATPAPTLSIAAGWIAKIEKEAQRSPDNEPLQNRLIQLRIHRAQRATYEQVLSNEIMGMGSPDPRLIWDGTTLETVITRLFDESKSATTLEDKTRIRHLMQQEPNLSEARQTALNALQLNPVQPRTHLRLALLDAASGRPWKDSFCHAMRLSAADPKLSFATGLLGWAARDSQAMTSQWRQTLQTSAVHADTILRLTRMRLTDEQVIEQLIPTRWDIPYRLALKLSTQDDKILRSALLKAAEELASKAHDVRNSDRAAIASAQDRHEEAATFLAADVDDSPSDPEKRYRYAVGLLRAGRTKEAIVESRVALNLSPGNAEYRDLFDRVRAAREKQNLDSAAQRPTRER